MFNSFDFCLPTKSSTVPSSTDWLHEVKHDGYRSAWSATGDRVRLITRGGYDWTKRYPWDHGCRAQGPAEAVRDRRRGRGARRRRHRRLQCAAVAQA